MFSTDKLTTFYSYQSVNNVYCTMYYIVSFSDDSEWNSEYRQLDKQMKRLGDWFSKAADVKCTGNGEVPSLLYMYVV